MDNAFQQANRFCDATGQSSPSLDSDPLVAGRSVSQGRCGLKLFAFQEQRGKRAVHRGQTDLRQKDEDQSNLLKLFRIEDYHGSLHGKLFWLGQSQTLEILNTPWLFQNSEINSPQLLHFRRLHCNP